MSKYQIFVISQRENVNELPVMLKYPTTRQRVRVVVIVVITLVTKQENPFIRRGKKVLQPPSTSPLDCPSPTKAVWGKTTPRA